MTIIVTEEMLAQLASLNIKTELAKPEEITFEVKVDRTWTWLKFSDKPSETTRKTMKALGGRFSGKRKAWYFKIELEKLALEAIADTL